METTAKEASEFSPMIKTFADLLASPGVRGGQKDNKVRDKYVYLTGWELMVKFISHTLKMNQINLECHLEKQLKRDLREVKTAANKQANIQPTTWVTVVTQMPQS